MEYLSEKKKTQTPDKAPNNTSEPPSSSLPNSLVQSIARGTTAPTSDMLGRRENLAPALQEKMQGAFGADFSNLEIYRSETARDAGMLGIASGNKVALAPEIDLNSHMGQAVLGHELSHVVAQAKGIGSTGRGIMETPSLERQAMIEGEKAASGMSVFAGIGLSEASSMPTFSEGMSTLGAETLTPISAESGAFGMGAPMQGKFWNKPDEKKDPLSSPKQLKKTLNKGSADEKVSALTDYFTHYSVLDNALKEEVDQGKTPAMQAEARMDEMMDPAMREVVNTYLAGLEQNESAETKDAFVNALINRNEQQTRELAQVYDSADRISTENIPGSFEDISSTVMENMASSERRDRLAGLQSPEAQEKYRRKFHANFYVSNSREARRMEGYIGLMSTIGMNDDRSDPESVYMRLISHANEQRQLPEVRALLAKTQASSAGENELRGQAVAFGPGGAELQQHAKQQHLQEALRKLGKK